MNRNDINQRAALYSSLVSSEPLPPEMTGTAEDVAQRIRASIKATQKT